MNLCLTSKRRFRSPTRPPEEQRPRWVVVASLAALVAGLAFVAVQAVALVAGLAFAAVQAVALVAGLTFIAVRAVRVGSYALFQHFDVQFDFLFHFFHLLPRDVSV